MLTRKTIVAGRFYPGEPDACLRSLQACLDGVEPVAMPRRLLGGVVPHAGWMCSGRVAGRVFQALADPQPPETLVLLGAMHRPTPDTAAMYACGHWETALGAVEVDADLARAVSAEADGVTEAPEVHGQEHSLEVQMPFVRALLPDTKVLPIMVAPVPHAVSLGASLAAVLRGCGKRAAVVGTTDLTHYGPSYDFEPQGQGIEGVRWARDVNDRRMVDLLADMRAEEIVPEARARQNACGAGAVATAVAAVAALGGDRAVVLDKTTSHDVLGGAPVRDSVGYVGMVFGCDDDAGN